MSASTSLTPAMSRLFSRTRNAGEDSDGGIGAMHSVSKVRHMIGQCLNNSMYRNACTLADLLIQLPDSSTEDILLLGRCFHLSGESRRCLAVLEHHGVLAAEKISYLSSILTHNLQDEVSALMNNNSNEGESELAGLNFTLQVVHMAARCLYSLNQYEDCVNLLEPLLADGTNETTDNDLSDMMRNDKRTLMIARAQEFCYLSSSDSDEVNVVASIYCIAGRCFHFLENRPRATALLVNSLRIDGACLEALEYILENALLSAPEKKSLLDLVCLKDREWLHAHYRFQLLDDWSSFESNEEVKNEQAHFGRGGKQGGEYVYDMHLSAVYLINKAERLFDVQHFAEAYKLARQAYVLDPFDMRGLHVYIGSMVELGLKTELFYLSHELINTYPKNPTSWYSVGCYYWACRKLEHAQKYIQKVIKLDKRASRAWIILGHILAAQEESEHAISAFRSASRLLPGDHRPIVFMAKELVRTNHLSLGLHLLSSALKISPRDATVHNEIGVILLKQERLEEALHHLQLAASITYEATGAQDTKMRSSRACGDEVFSNYATALRRSGRLEEALHWYELCLAINPSDAGVHANIAFTLHLSQKFTKAINEYHAALALQPNFSFCTDMLTKAMEDFVMYGGDLEGEHYDEENGEESFSSSFDNEESMDNEKVRSFSGVTSFL